MSELKEKIAYLQGLAEGIQLDKESKEGKLFNAVIDVLDEIAVAIDGVSNNQLEMQSYLEAIDEDLGDVEDDLYGDEEFDYEGDDECDQNCCEECSCNYVEVACPNCHDLLQLDSCMLEDNDVTEITCPNCNEIIYVNEDTLAMKEDKKE